MTLASTDIQQTLNAILGQHNWTDDREKILPYLHSSTGTTAERTAFAVTRPSNVEQVQRLMCFCQQHQIAIVPQGGNTGRCDGALPQQSNSMILSLEKLNQIRSIEPASKTVVVDSGIVLDVLNAKLQKHNLWFPISLGASGSCQIGGNIATNAGGINALKYGTTRKLVLGLEAVLADGSLYRHLSLLHKDNRGYAIDQLLMGSEGTLAILTGASLKLVTKPSHYITYFLASDALAHLLVVFAKLQQATQDQISAAEAMSQRSLLQMREVFATPEPPLPLDKPWYGLFEVDGQESQVSSLQSILQNTLMDMVEQGKITQVVEAQNEAQRQSFWKMREKIVAAPLQLIDRRRFVRSDIAVPLHQLPNLFTQIENGLPSFAGNFLSYPYGHMGDGNIHYNFYTEEHLTDKVFASYARDVSHFVRDTALSLDGTFSAEHGIGSLKMDDLVSSLTCPHLRLLIDVKKAFDPHQVLNPHTVIPSSFLKEKSSTPPLKA